MSKKLPSARDVFKQRAKRPKEQRGQLLPSDYWVLYELLRIGLINLSHPMGFGEVWADFDLDDKKKRLDFFQNYGKKGKNNAKHRDFQRDELQSHPSALVLSKIADMLFASRHLGVVPDWDAPHEIPHGFTAKSYETIQKYCETQLLYCHAEWQCRHRLAKSFEFRGGSKPRLSPLFWGLEPSLAVAIDIITLGASRKDVPLSLVADAVSVVHAIRTLRLHKSKGAWVPALIVLASSLMSIAYEPTEYLADHAEEVRKNRRESAQRASLAQKQNKNARHDHDKELAKQIIHGMLRARPKDDPKCDRVIDNMLNPSYIFTGEDGKEAQLKDRPILSKSTLQRKGVIDSAFVAKETTKFRKRLKAKP